MRAYFLGNFYLSSIQQGIQAAHCMVELFTKYPAPNDDFESEESKEICTVLWDWAQDHKTMILLNGGNSTELYGIRYHFEQEENPYPFAMFEESVDALSGAVTCVGIILPEKIYTAAEEIRNDIGYHRLSIWERELCEIRNSCGLAR